MPQPEGWKNPAVVASNKLYKSIIAIAVILFLIPVVLMNVFHDYKLQIWAGFAVFLVLLWLASPRRRYPTAEKVSEGIDLKDKVVLVTGVTSGIGTEAARVFALRGAHVVLVARNEKKLQDIAEQIKQSVTKKDALLQPKLTCLTCDLDDLNSVKGCAEQFERAKIKELHILVCNAGIMALPTRTETKNGLEAQVGTNHVAHSFLVMCLEKFMLDAYDNGGQKEKSRLVVLSSSAHRMCEHTFLQDKNLETEPYEAWTAYGNSKVSNLLFAKEFHERNKDRGIVAFSVNPGGIHTGLQGSVEMLIKVAWLIVTPFVFKSIAQGAATTVTCALKPGIEEEHGGKYFDNCAPTDAAATFEASLSKSLGESAQKALWLKTQALILKGLAKK